jgi:hypothetical protein
MANIQNQLTQEQSAYKTFTGADITAYFDHIRVGTLQAITVSITREVQPIYVMGSPEPKAFAKGKRGIAGTLIFSQFDRDALTRGIFPNYSQIQLADMPSFADLNTAALSTQVKYRKEFQDAMLQDLQTRP